MTSRFGTLKKKHDPRENVNKFMRHNFGEDEKEQLKKDDKKERKKCMITSRIFKIRGQQKKKRKVG